MQSWEDEILLLPALPSAWPTGSVRGLRARGACVVDLSWRDGALVEAVLTSPRASRLQVRSGAKRVTVALTPGKPVYLRGPALRRT